MLTIQHSIESTRSAKQFVDLCESDFERRIDTMVDSVLDGGKTKFITLSGPTCSGKTTTANKLTSETEERGFSARVISIDDFYRDDLRKAEKPDLESAAALDLDCFARFTEDLLAGRTAHKPVYDMSIGKRARLDEFVPSENDIYIFEGIQAVYPEITCHLDGFSYKSLFICVDEDVSLNGIYFEKNEIRLMRRLVRDSLFRSTDFEQTLMLWDSVRRNEEKNIFPNAVNSHYRINSFLPYELFLLGKYFLPKAEKMIERIEKHPALISIKDKLEKTTNPYITEEMIPEKSMFREFIG